MRNRALALGSSLLVGENLNLVIGLVVVRNASTIGPNELLINESLASLTKQLKIRD
jgi:hypothetical protein